MKISSGSKLRVAVYFSALLLQFMLVWFLHFSKFVTIYNGPMVGVAIAFMSLVYAYLIGRVERWSRTRLRDGNGNPLVSERHLRL